MGRCALIASRPIFRWGRWEGILASKGVHVTRQELVWLGDRKDQGDWAELCFMARAAREGLLVSRPFSGSARYDVGVEYRGLHMRVQVKSTLYRRRGESYSLNVMGPKRQPYAEGEIDFLAVYLIPIEQWYIVPQASLRTRRGPMCTFHITPESKRQKWVEYREAWHLLRGERSSHKG